MKLESYMILESYMTIAIQEAQASLRKGNNGFGAVIIKQDVMIASAHDTEDSDHDPTSHAEINVIKKACKLLGKNLSDCILISTHEPCPMCSGAIIWSGIRLIAFGYSIQDAITQNRKRICIPCEEIFARAKVDIKVFSSIRQNECATLYRKDVRQEIKNLRACFKIHPAENNFQSQSRVTDPAALAALGENSIQRRFDWFQANRDHFDFITDDLLYSAYLLILHRLHISPDEAPIVKRTNTNITFHSMNFCPTLEACKILNLDTKHICSQINEVSMDKLIKQIDSHLCFTRNYKKLRPYANYCEETISLLPNHIL